MHVMKIWTKLKLTPYDKLELWAWQDTQVKSGFAIKQDTNDMHKSTHIVVDNM